MSSNSVASGDEPLLPPDSVARRIPNWTACGAQSCGHHNSNKASADDLVDRHRLCCNCLKTTRVCELHVFPCGHFECRQCLEVRARDVLNRIARDHERIANLESSVFFYERRAASEVDRPHLAKIAREVADRWQIEVWQHAGLVCCGKRIDLEPWTSCLMPQIARPLWLALKMLHTEPSKRERCGWPDCRAFLPGECRWSENGIEKYRCVKCGGNSQETSKGMIPCR